MSPSDARGDRALRQILATVLLTFLGYATVALPLAVVPGFVTGHLGFGAVVAGAAISTQYVATVLSRARVGQMTDVQGPKKAVLWGFSGCVLSGALTIGADAARDMPALSLALLGGGRLALGLAESWISTGAITWAIGQVGAGQTVRIISWNGIATYGAIALGAPVGVTLERQFGFGSIGVCTALVGLVGLGLAAAKAAVAVVATERLPQRRVFARIAPYGFGLALGATGFGVMAAFVALYFQSRGWPGASVALSLFGIGFIAARLLMGGVITRHGGLRVALVAFLIEAVGLAMVWLAPVPSLAVAGAGVAGFGFAPVFPALGVVAVGTVPPQNRGAAIGLFSVFLDVALGLTGPLAGLLIERFGHAAPFALGVAAALGGMGMMAAMLAR